MRGCFNVYSLCLLDVARFERNVNKPLEATEKQIFKAGVCRGIKGDESVVSEDVGEILFLLFTGRYK